MNYRDHIWLVKMAAEAGITPEEMRLEIQKSSFKFFKFVDNIMKIVGIVLLILVLYLTTVLPILDSIKMVSELVAIALTGWLILKVGYKLIDHLLPDEKMRGNI